MVPAPYDPDVALPSSQRLQRTSNRSNGRFCETGARAPENRRLAFCFAVASCTPAAASSHPHTALVLSRRMGTYGSVCESGMASFKSQRLRRTTNPSNGRLRWVIREDRRPARVLFRVGLALAVSLQRRRNALVLSTRARTSLAVYESGVASFNSGSGTHFTHAKSNPGSRPAFDPHNNMSPVASTCESTRVGFMASIRPRPLRVTNAPYPGHLVKTARFSSPPRPCTCLRREQGPLYIHVNAKNSSRRVRQSNDAGRRPAGPPRAH